MLQIILIIVWVSASGEKQSIGVEHDSLSECYAQANATMAAATDEFEKLGLLSVTAGCMVRVKSNPA